MDIPAKYPINLHKGLTLVVVLGMMLIWQNFSVGAWVYLALHGTYGVLWLLKDAMFPDPRWEEPMRLSQAIVVFVLLGAYWIAPFLLISRGVEPPAPLLAAAIALNILGTFLHYASDAQKYFVLQARSGLIDDGFFARTRNPNYLGEMLIYAAFAMLAMHWLPWVIVVGFWAAIFWPNMQAKERSLARYPGFAAYQGRSGLLLPRWWPLTDPPPAGSPTEQTPES